MYRDPVWKNGSIILRKETIPYSRQNKWCKWYLLKLVSCVKHTNTRRHVPDTRDLIYFSQSTVPRIQCSFFCLPLVPHFTLHDTFSLTVQWPVGCCLLWCVTAHRSRSCPPICTCSWNTRFIHCNIHTKINLQFLT